MNKKITVLITLGLLFSAQLFYGASPFKPELYQEINTKALKTMPEEYRNKKIWYQSRFEGFRKFFPNYIINSGFKSDKYYWFIIKPGIIPVMTKKTDEYTKLLLIMQKGTTVKVYGKLKKLRHSPKKMQQDFYYLDLEKIEIITTPQEERKLAKKKAKEQNDNTNGKPLTRKERKLLKKKKEQEELGGVVDEP